MRSLMWEYILLIINVPAGNKSYTWVKVIVTRRIIFLDGLNILISTFCVCAFQGLLKAFHYPIQLLSFFLLLWNNLLMLNMLTETFLKTPFSVIGWCSLVPASHWLKRKCGGIHLSQAAPGMILQYHRRVPVSIFSIKIAALGSLKRVTG